MLVKKLKKSKNNNNKWVTNMNIIISQCKENAKHTMQFFIETS